MRASFASVPLLTRKTLPGWPTSERSFSASSISRSCRKRLEVWAIVATCFETASTSAGWAWPSEETAMPPMKSTYSLPSASHTVAPSPRTSAAGGVP